MLQNVGLSVAGLVMLLVGGRLLVAAAVDTARRLGVSPLLVGLTLVAWGTSAPELALNLVSASKGRGDLALGNVVGANICNMALVLGACAAVKPLVVGERLIHLEIRLNAVVLGFMGVVGALTGLARWTAGAMLGVFIAYSAWTIAAGLRASRAGDGSDTPTAEASGMHDPTRPGAPMGWLMIASCFVGGLVLLSVGGSLASDGASAIAMALGVPSAVVGVTVVSIGTTLPELITGVTAVRRGQTDLAMGNAIGSCLFNAGAIYGLSGLLAPPASAEVLTVPLVYMAVLAVVLIPLSATTSRVVSRVEGALLLASYAVFLVSSAVRAL